MEKNKKRIVCYGDSNTWGYDAESDGRFDDCVRWPRVLEAALGGGFSVIEEGLNGRTTVFDDPLNPGLNGLRYLRVCLMTHAPLDHVVLMLGTNDAKQRFAATPRNIADGVERLVDLARSLDVWRGAAKPILIVAPLIIPPEYAGSRVAGEMGRGCAEKTGELPGLLRDAASRKGCAFLDSNTVCEPNTIDYMHLSRESHARLGAAIAEKIKQAGEIANFNR